jgi:hypothetical protein
MPLAEMKRLLEKDLVANLNWVWRDNFDRLIAVAEAARKYRDGEDDTSLMPIWNALMELEAE